MATSQIFPVVGSSFNVPNPLPVTGTLTNDNAAPSSDNVGVLPALATASAQSWTNGDQVLLSEDLLGNLRVVIENGAVVNSAPNLLTAANYAILAASAITGSAGAGSVISGGNIGISPNNATSVTEFPPSVLLSPGVFDYDDAAAIQAQLDLTAAIAYYSGLTFTSLSGSSANLSVLGNGSTAATYTAGNYSAGTSMDIPTSITLDAQGNANAIFVFKAGSTLKLESGASVLLVNGAQAANVFWVVGTSFTSVWNGVISNMVGTIMAADSITLGGGTLIGRALAQTAAVTLSTTETITVPTGANAGPAVPVVFTGIANVNVVEWAGLVLAPPTNFGTAPTGLVIGGNVSIFAGYSALVVDGSGNLKVDIAAGSLGSVTALISGSVTVGNFPALQNVNVTEWDGIALGAPSKFGTAPTGVVIGGNVSLFAGYSALVVDGSSNLYVNVAAGSVNAVMEDLDFFGVYHPVAGDTTGKLRVTGATMNPVIVQGSLAQGAITQVAIASTTCVKAFPKAVQLGDTLVVLVATGLQTIVTLKDSLNLQWQTAGVQAQAGSGLTIAFFAIVTTAGTPTVTATSASTDIAMALYEIEGAGSLDLSAASSLVSTGTAVAVNCSVTQPYDIGFMVVGAAAGVISAASPNSPASSVFDTGNVAVAGASVLNNFGAFSAEFGHPIDIVSSEQEMTRIHSKLRLVRP